MKDDTQIIFLFSAQAAEKHGYNTVTLKDNKKFIMTGMFEESSYNDESYGWKDKVIMHQCLKSEMLSNITHRFPDEVKRFDKDFFNKDFDDFRAQVGSPDSVAQSMKKIRDAAADKELADSFKKKII